MEGGVWDGHDALLMGSDNLVGVVHFIHVTSKTIQNVQL